MLERLASLNSNDLDEKCSSTIKVRSWYLPGGTEKHSFSISDVVVDFPKQQFLNTSLECGLNTNHVAQLWSDGQKTTYITSQRKSLDH
jgi:hypothetical protein